MLAGVRLALVAGLVSLAVGALWRYLRTSEDFALQTVVVAGSARASEGAIVRLSGLDLGQNLFSVDVEEVARLVEAHPWVAGARVRRVYPAEVRIELEEHEPVVLVSLGHLYYANALGEIVKRHAPGEDADLPVITGLSRENVESDDGRAPAQIREVLAFLDALREVGGDRASTVAEVHLDPALGLSAVWSGSDERVVFGSPPWKPRIERLIAVDGLLAERGLRPARVLLNGDRRAGRAVVRFTAPRVDRAAEQAGLRPGSEPSQPSSLVSAASLDASVEKLRELQRAMAARE